MGGRKRGADVGPSTRLVGEYRRRNQQSNGGEQADGDVHIRDRAHTRDGSEENDEAGEEIFAEIRADDGGEDEVENVAAADELVTGDGGVGEEDGNHAEDASGLVVPGFEQVGNRELGELAGAGRDEVDKQEPGPATGPLPQSSKAMFIGIFCTGEKRARANPGRQKGEDEDKGWKRASGHQVVSFGLHLAKATERDNKKSEDDEAKDDRVEVHEVGDKCTGWWAVRYRRMRLYARQMGRTGPHVKFYQTLQAGTCTMG